jgi:hypothetical protein
MPSTPGLLWDGALEAHVSTSSSVHSDVKALFVAASKQVEGGICVSSSISGILTANLFFEGLHLLPK